MRPELPLDQMSTEDKILTMEALWDSLTDDGAEIPSPDLHGAVVEERLRKLEAGDARLVPLAELKARRPR